MADSHDIVTSEIWKPVVGYEGIYEVSNHGRVRSLSRQVKSPWGKTLQTKERIFRGVIDNNHSRVKLCREGRITRVFIHRLVLIAFVGPCPENMVCCHCDGNGTNNRLENLRWDTPKSNGEDSVKHGVQICAENHHKAKLTWADVEKIRRLNASGMSHREISSLFGVTSQNIREIARGKTWRIRSIA